MTILRRMSALLAAGLVASGAATMAPAAPLNEETCEQLKREVGDLEGIGARNNMSKGPAWAKTNLSAAQLEQIRKLIEIEEAIAFRCLRPKPPVVQQVAAAPSKVKTKAKSDAPVKAKTDPKKAKAAPSQASAAGVAAPKPKPAATASSKEGKSKEAAAPGATPPAPRAKPPAPKTAVPAKASAQ